MQITHEEARRLIQFNVDDTLNPQEKTVLSTHLQMCFGCRVYAEEINELESTLVPLMKRQWNRRPIPLSITTLKAKRNIKLFSKNILAIRKAIISFIFVAFAVSMWQFMDSGQQLPGLSPIIVSPLPTPSIESTSTTISSKNCEHIRYIVQANDTLSSIADQFSRSKEEIISTNDLKTETINIGMMLMIPACNFTPTSVVKPTMSMTVLSPVISSATSSPEPNRY
jgi:LysM repeat protein